MQLQLQSEDHDTDDDDADDNPERWPKRFTQPVEACAAACLAARVEGGSARIKYGSEFRSESSHQPNFEGEHRLQSRAPAAHWRRPSPPPPARSHRQRCRPVPLCAVGAPAHAGANAPVGASARARPAHQQRLPPPHHAAAGVVVVAAPARSCSHWPCERGSRPCRSRVAYTPSPCIRPPPTRPRRVGVGQDVFARPCFLPSFHVGYVEPDAHVYEPSPSKRFCFHSPA